ncbi:4'-phosphopantetheinyl transferase family protein [Roseimaritima sediminicola]|uniref:4'-phosphopantetheinyl transferase family protein n=1 Tax=Roseimaritima sediminicola TaxID=2662066 RepID=UPI001298519D|nr:4'-phosphopantetheinyl transferase superfamily protein [Roseimaritima sediminicola]
MGIEVWHAAAAVDQGGPLEAACQRWLSREEQQHAERYRKATTRNQFIVGRGMARRLLAERLNCEPQAIRFRHAEHGKPHLVDEAGIEFNVAHTGGLVAVALGGSEPVGVDVECLSRRIDLGIAQRYFSAPEVDYLHRQPAAQQPEVFLRIWTLKESFIKAIGTGLTMPLDRFAFAALDSDRPQLSFVPDDSEQARLWGPAGRWHSQLLRPQADYLIAVTTRRADAPPINLQPFTVA